MAAPSVPAVRSYLVTLFRAALLTPYPEITVTYGDPGGVAALKYAWVAVTATNDAGVERERRLLPDTGRRNRAETYTLSAVVWVPVPGDWSSDGQQAASELAWGIAGALDEALRASNTTQTAGGLVEHVYVSRFDDSEYLDNTQRGAQIVCDIAVHKSRT